MAHVEKSGLELIQTVEDHKDKVVKMPSEATLAENAVKTENGELKTRSLANVLQSSRGRLLLLEPLTSMLLVI